MSQSEPDEDQGLSGRTLKDMAAAAAAGALGYVAGGPIGAVVGASLQPAFSALPEFVAIAKRDHARRNAEAMFESALDGAGQTPEELEQLLDENPRLLNLTWTAITSAAATDLDWKIRLLGRLVAEGINAEDEAMLDNTAMFVAAAQEIDRPHVAVLQQLTTWQANEGSPVRRTLDGPPSSQPLYTMERLEQKLPKYGVSLHAIVSTLERNGLISMPQADLSKAFNEYGQRLANSIRTNTAYAPHFPEPGWKITAFGIAMLRHLNEVGIAQVEEHEIQPQG